MNRRLPVALAITVLLASFASAALEFETTRLELKPTAGVKTVDAEFPFKNTGATPVKVIEVSSSCGCTVPEVSPKDYPAGGQGVVKAHFSVGERQGLQTKIITVHTDAGDQQLELVVDLPRRLEITPRLVLFRETDLAEHVVKLTFGSDTPMQSVTLSDPGAAFAAELVVDQPGIAYSLKVKPVGRPESDQRATLQIHSKGASGLDYTDALYLRYVATPAAPAKPAPAPAAEAAR